VDQACITSLECGAEHCIDGVCRPAYVHETSNAFIGNGRGYVAEIVIGDALAALVVPITIVPTWSSDPWIWSICTATQDDSSTGAWIGVMVGVAGAVLMTDRTVS
jgi:hypothetical protein